MKLIKNKKGYTVVETLIVLAVTGALFITTALLIQGQVEKNRYQAGMRQLQQMVQQAMRDTENGYFPNAAGDNANRVFAGKRIHFCTAGASNNDGSSRQPCVGRGNTVRTENIYWDPTVTTPPYAGPTFDTDTEVTNGREVYMTYPADIQYKKFKKSDGSWNSSSSGFAVMFSNLNSAESATQAVKLYYPYIDNNDISDGGAVRSRGDEDLWTLGSQSYHANGMMVCFEGRENGSLVIGRGGALTVEMNLDDPACD